MACQLGSVLEVTPTPRPVRDDDDDDDGDPPPDEDEEAPTPVAEEPTPVVETPTPEPEGPVTSAVTIEQLQAATRLPKPMARAFTPCRCCWNGAFAILGSPA